MSISAKNKKIEASSDSKHYVNISPIEKLELLKNYEMKNGVSTDTLIERANLLISLKEYQTNACDAPNLRGWRSGLPLAPFLELAE